MSKRILIHSIVFSPDSVSTAYIYRDIALGLVDDGFEVIVLTSTPHYNLLDSELVNQPLTPRLFGFYYESTLNKIKVIHIPLTKYKSTLLRILSFVIWHFKSLIYGLFIRNISCILSPSPPLTIGLVSLIIAKFKRAKVIYNVQEIYPDLLINQGSIKSKVLIRVLRVLEKVVYNFSDRVVTIDHSFKRIIRSRFKNQSKLDVITNFVDIDTYKPMEEIRLDLPKIFSKPSGKFILMYAGNIGYYQNWEPVLYAAKQLINSDVEFWIIGEGVYKDVLRQQITNMALHNVKLFPYQSRDIIPKINNIADSHFLCVNPNMDSQGFPSKIYTVMACAKPLIVVSSKDSPIYKFLKNKGCAFLLTQDVNLQFVNSIIKLKNNKNLCDSMGKKGLNWVHNQYSKQVVIKQYVALVNSLIRF